MNDDSKIHKSEVTRSGWPSRLVLASGQNPGLSDSRGRVLQTPGCKDPTDATVSQHVLCCCRLPSARSHNGRNGLWLASWGHGGHEAFPDSLRKTWLLATWPCVWDSASLLPSCPPPRLPAYLCLLPGSENRTRFTFNLSTLATMFYWVFNMDGVPRFVNSCKVPFLCLRGLQWAVPSRRACSPSICRGEGGVSSSSGHRSAAVIKWKTEWLHC